MAKRQLVLWRHGRTSWNFQQRFQGQTDIPLDEVGEQQAKNAAQLLQHLNPVYIASSDLIRANKTGLELAALMKLDVTQDKNFRETAHGLWEGLTFSELKEKYYDDYINWSQGMEIRPGQAGETRQEVADRMVTGIENHIKHVPDNSVFVIATHGGAARVCAGKLMGLPANSWISLGIISNCSWIILSEPEYSGAPWRLVEYNAGSLPTPALSDDR
jgi:probable phosphoglycerate mutase